MPPGEYRLQGTIQNFSNGPVGGEQDVGTVDQEVEIGVGKEIDLGPIPVKKK